MNEKDDQFTIYSFWSFKYGLALLNCHVAVFQILQEPAFVSYLDCCGRASEVWQKLAKLYISCQMPTVCISLNMEKQYLPAYSLRTS